jgi:hypothetical protein
MSIFLEFRNPFIGTFLLGTSAFLSTFPYRKTRYFLLQRLLHLYTYYMGTEMAKLGNQDL